MGKSKGKFKRTGGKTGGRDFVPGQSGNPNGRPKAPVDQKLAMQQVRAIQSEIRFDWQHYYRDLIGLSQSELTRLVGDKEYPPSPDVPVLKLLVARSLLYAMKTGKASELQTHREAMCGPEPKQVELSGPGGEPLNPLAGYTQDKLASAFLTLDRLIKEAECKSIPSSPPQLESSPQSLPPPSGTAS